MMHASANDGCTDEDRKNGESRLDGEILWTATCEFHLISQDQEKLIRAVYQWELMATQMASAQGNQTECWLVKRLKQGRMGKFRWKGIYQFSYNSDNLGNDSCHTMVAIF